MSESTQALSAPAPVAAAPATTGRDRAVLLVYTAAIFTSAFLLFLVQPMFSRMVLPLLGGTPEVWNTCMLFFQAALLGGYLYAHLGARYLGIRRQAAAHAVLLALAALMLPVGVAGAAPRGGQAPIPWLLWLMATTVGLPFLVLSATGPMLQKWFAGTGHPGAKNPYWLYAASNVGSMLALLGYPFVMEPRLRLAQQSATWSAGYAVLAVLVIASGFVLWRLAPAGAIAAADASESAGAEAGAGAGADRVAGRERLVWIGLAFIPSSLLLSVTSYITTDVAPVPLLWVLPLALYLLTFTLAFATRPPLRHRWMLAVHPSVLAGVALLMMTGWIRRPMPLIAAHLAGLFVVALVCHGELARRRPPVRHLTEFYLWIAVGGVLGGIFNVLVAPVAFTRTWEYPIVLTLACLARPWPRRHSTQRDLLLGLLRAAAFAFALVLVARSGVPWIPHWLSLVLAGVLLLLISPGLGRAPLWLAVCLGITLFYWSDRELRNQNTLLAHRSFYGRFTVQNEAQGLYHALYHGSTLHGAQSMFFGATREPLTYYVKSGPLGRLFAARAAEAGHRRVAVIGLGTGTTAAYANAGEDWTFYEIDPGVLAMSSNPKYFRYLSESPARTRVVLGDARLSIAHAPPHGYDMIVVDAFNSDAIPVHLLTSEAIGIYMSKLAPGGVVMLHLSNRYLDLRPARVPALREHVGRGRPQRGRPGHHGGRRVLAPDPQPQEHPALDGRLFQPAERVGEAGEGLNRGARC